MKKFKIEKQKTFGKPVPKISYGPYNKSNKSEQWIRISEGCPNNCPFCYETTEIKLFGVPEIVRNRVKIMDMNLICKPESLEIIRDLGKKRVNGKVVRYELICGIDYRFLTKEISDALKKSRFGNIRIAWDWFYRDQMKIKDALKVLKKSGFHAEEIMVFMICNWKIPYGENLKKLDLCKVWNVKVADCYFDNQTSPNIIPEFWTKKEIKDFRQKVRKHNQLVLFKIDPEIRRIVKKKIILGDSLE